MSDNDTQEYLSALGAVGRNATAEVERLATDNKRLRAINAELLEALKSIVMFNDDCGGDEIGFNPEGPLMSKAKAAIAKAKGE